MVILASISTIRVMLSVSSLGLQMIIFFWPRMSELLTTLSVWLIEEGDFGSMEYGIREMRFSIIWRARSWHSDRSKHIYNSQAITPVIAGKAYIPFHAQEWRYVMRQLVSCRRHKYEPNYITPRNISASGNILSLSLLHFDHARNHSQIVILPISVDANCKHNLKLFWFLVTLSSIIARRRFKRLSLK